MRKKMAAALCLVAGSGFLVLALGAHPGTGTDQHGRLERGHAITPVALDFSGRNVRAVMRGSYIVNGIGGCNDCHTCPAYAPDHNPFDGTGDGQINAANFLAGGVNFGIAVSANLTPDASGRPAGLTREEFFSALQTGHDPANSAHVLQVMPWPIYKNMIDADLYAIYEYLSAIPPAEPGTCSAPGE